MPNPVGSGGLGSFGEGVLQGYDTGLSNYATVAELARRRQLAGMEMQSGRLQNLLHGVSLAQAAPEAATALPPDMFPEGTQPAVQAAADFAIKQRNASAKLFSGMMSGSAEGFAAALNDPEVAAFAGQHPKEYGAMIQQMLNQKRIHDISTHPTMTPQEKAQALTGIPGVNPSMFEMGNPGAPANLAGQREAATKQADIDTQLKINTDLGMPQGQAVEEFKRRGNLRGGMYQAPGFPEGTTLEQAGAAERTRGTKGAEVEVAQRPASPYAIANPQFTNTGVEAAAKQTPEVTEQHKARTRYLNKATEAMPSQKIGMEKEEQRKVLDQLMKTGYAMDTTGHLYRPEDIPGLAQQVQGQAGRTMRAPQAVTVGNETLPVFKTGIPTGGWANIDDAAKIDFLKQEAAKFVGQRAVIGADKNGPIVGIVTKEMFQKAYAPFLPRTLR